MRVPTGKRKPSVTHTVRDVKMDVLDLFCMLTLTLSVDVNGDGS